MLSLGLNRHENIIAILDIVRPLTFELFTEVYLIQVRPPLLSVLRDRTGFNESLRLSRN